MVQNKLFEDIVLRDLQWCTIKYVLEGHFNPLLKAIISLAATDLMDEFNINILVQIYIRIKSFLVGGNGKTILSPLSLHLAVTDE